MNAIQTSHLSIMKNPAFKKVIVYLVLTFTLCIPFYYYIISTGDVDAGGGIYVIGLMWCPGVAALLTRLVFQRNLRGMGWGWGKTRYQVWGYLLPIIACLAVYGITWSTGLGGFSSETLTSEAGFGLPLAFAMQATSGVLLFAIFTLGEELGWRGLLVPELSKITGFLQLSLISGVIWETYHLPIFFFADYHSAAPKWYAFLCFTVEVVAISFVYAWLRLKSGSIWPGVILHASFNLFEGVFNQLTVDRGYTEYFTTEFGLGLAIAYLLVAYWCWKRRNTLPQLASSEPEPIALTQAQLTTP
jgi:membrane protease YdiL (CAAX protease family)